MKSVARLYILTAAHSFGAVAHAGDAEFLKSLDSNWSGTGMVKVRVNSSPMNVSRRGDWQVAQVDLSSPSSILPFAIAI
jgi:hypothetical protein